MDEIKQPEVATSQPGMIVSAAPGPNPKIKWAIIAVVVLLVVGGGVFAYLSSSSKSPTNQKADSNVIAIVGQHKITTDEMLTYYSTEVAVAQDEIIDTLMEVKLYEDIASDLHIKADQALIATAKKEHIEVDPDLAKSNYVALLAKRDALLKQIESHVSGRATGQFVVAEFSQHIPFEGRNDNTNPPAGREQRIADDKTYATKFITSIKADLSSKKITFDQAIEREHKDPYLGEVALATALHSGSFDTGDSTQTSSSLFARADVVAALKNQKAGTISEPFIVHIETSVTDPPAQSEGKWMIVKLDTKQEADGQKSADQIINDKKKSGGFKKL